jgi:hypothetical protein
MGVLVGGDMGGAGPGSRMNGLGAASVASGLVLSSLALLRTHELLSGLDPAPGVLVAAAAMLALWLLGRSPASGRAARACAIGAAAWLALASATAGGVLEHLSGLGAALLTTLLVAVGVGLSARAGALRLLALGGGGPALLAAGLSAVAGSLVLLPHAGTMASGVLGALLVLPALRGVSEADEPGPLDHPTAGAVRGLGVGLLMGGAAWLATTSAAAPWPLGGVVAGLLLLGAALGLACRASRLPASLAFATGLLAAALVAGSAAAQGLLDHLRAGMTLPVVGVLGGTLALLHAGVLFGLAPGLLCGVTGPAAAWRGPLLPATAAGLLLAPPLAKLLAAHDTVLAAGAALLVGIAARRPDARVGRGLLAGAVGLGLMLLSVLHEEGTAPMGAFGSVRAGVGHLAVARTVAPGTLAEAQVLALDAHRVQATSALARSEDVLAGHLAALLPTACTRALVIGPAGRDTLEALAAHGVAEVVHLDLSRILASAAPDADLATASGSAPSPAAWPEREGGWDALLVLPADPTLPAASALFTPQAAARARELLADGGAFVQRLDASRLGPDNLTRELLRLRAAFPGLHVFTATVARSGLVLAAARSGAASDARLPVGRLLLDADVNPLATPAVLASLRRATLIKRDDLLRSIALGPQGIEATSRGLRAADPWRAGGLAVRWPAEESRALPLARGDLFARAPVLELELDPTPLSGEEGATRFPLVEVETTLDPAWQAKVLAIRMPGAYVPHAGEWGLYREALARLVVEREGRRLTVYERPQTQGSERTLADSIHGFWKEGEVKRSGTALVRGHPALWIFSEPSLARQLVHLTWHCPVQGKLYAAELDLTDGKPGMHEEPLDTLLRNLRCRHG